MITVEYVEDGEVISDFKTDDWVEDVYTKFSYVTTWRFYH